MNPLPVTRLGGTPRQWAAVYFRESGIDLTVARPANGEPQVLRQATISAPAISAGEAPARSAWQASAQSLRQQLDPHNHHILTAVNAADTLCRTLSLPTTEPGELRQMLDLQIDNLTPLPLEEVVYDFEPLAAGNGQTRVLVAIARKDAVNQRVEALETAGLPPEWVGVNVLALFHGLQQRNLLPRDERLNMLVLCGVAGADVVLHSQGQPRGLRSFGAGEGGLGKPEARAALAEELQRTLLAEQAESPRGTIGRVSFAVWDEAARGPAAALTAEWPGAELLAAEAVPAASASLCLESAGSDTRRLNLLPDEWRQRRRSAHRRRILIRSGIALAVVYLLILAGLFTGTLLRQAQLRQVRAENRRLEPELLATRRLHSELLALQKQLDTKHSALEVLRQVCLLMTEKVKLSAFVFRRDDSVTLRGQADSASSVYEFISRLEHCDLFANVKTQAVRTEGAAGLTKFEILASLKSTPANRPPIHEFEQTRTAVAGDHRHRPGARRQLRALRAAHPRLEYRRLAIWPNSSATWPVRGPRLARRPGWRADYENLQRQFGQKMEQFAQMSDVLKKIEQVAAAAGARIEQQRPLTAVERDVYRELPVQSRIEATTDSLVKFLFALRTGSGFINVEQLQIAPKPDNPTILRCDILIQALAAKSERPSP